ncbi:hypothetical protein ILUMI_26247 [Ignelater luminosus]|uniref:Dynein axonemal assembly factor 1 homolog n=1 Tax=Ignelater luminosus TaxID=2038154 RepID=A0A8K0C8C0_IGNLU|nr:hypothetical protein ILUMI_26247 [Ignelater luminosus]
MDRCKQEEPKVIDNAMLEKCIEEQGPTGEAGRLAREEGIPLDEVEQIRLEFLKIIRIDHLWMLTSLTKLSLSNNLVERIENLEALVHLKELNLSFNKITKIENLTQLVNLEILSLFENQITKLENMDSLKKLIIFTIGKNCITDKNNIIYLRRFAELRSLNMAGNPCAEDEDFLTFVATFLPQIIYYQYRLVPTEERETGLTLYSDQLRSVAEEEAKKKEIQDKIEAEIAEAELHAGSFVEFLGSRHLFASLFEEDEEGLALLALNDEIRDSYAEFEEQFCTVTKQIFEMGQEQYQIRKTEVDQFFESINTAKKKSQQESIEKMEEFLVQKAKIFYQLRKLEDDLDNDEINVDDFNEKVQQYSDEYNDILHKIWKDLMALELTLYEQMEEVIQTFEQTLTEMINTFIEAAQGYFTELRSLEQVYSENVSTEAQAFQTMCNSQEDFPVPEELVVIMSDKEILNNALGASHDLHLQLIDAREDRLVSRARTWLNTLVTSLQKDEIARNRGKVLEINHFLDIQREEFEELHALNVGTTMIDPDISAVLN